MTTELYALNTTISHANDPKRLLVNGAKPEDGHARSHRTHWKVLSLPIIAYASDIRTRREKITSSFRNTRREPQQRVVRTDRPKEDLFRCGANHLSVFVTLRSA